MNIVKQTVSYNSLSGLHVSFQELEISAESENQYVISEFGEYRVIQKPHAKSGGYLINEVNANEYEWSKDHLDVFVTRYKLDLPESDINFEHDFDFYEVASHEFAKFELTKCLWVNRNGEIEPRRSEVTA